MKEILIGQYTLSTWLMYFYVYCFCGWVFESCYVSIRQKKWVNRGFLNGPFLPIYGSGAVMMLFVSYPFKENLVLTYIAGLFGATLLELVTGIVIEAIFKVRYWDYTPKRWNYKGYICASSSIAWGFFTIGMNLFLHPAIIFLTDLVPQMPMTILMSLISIALLVDMTVSTRDALDLRDALIRIESMKKEMLLLRRRADVAIACVDDSFEKFKKAHPSIERVEEIHNSIDQRLISAKKWVQEKNITVEETQLNEFGEVRSRMTGIIQRYQEMVGEKGSMLKQRIMNNPSMVSDYYKESLEALKESLK